MSPKPSQIIYPLAICGAKLFIIQWTIPFQLGHSNRP